MWAWRKKDILHLFMMSICVYKKAVRYGDKAFVKTWIESNDGLKTVYGYQIVNDEDDDLCRRDNHTYRREKR